MAFLGALKSFLLRFKKYMNWILQKINNSFIIVSIIEINGDDFVETSLLDIVEILVSKNTNFWLITTLLLIAYIGISKIKGFFCSSKSIEACESKSDGSKCTKLAQKDYTYLIVIVLIVSTFLVSLSLYTNEDAMSLFSFASTIASIILSVIAIILTITSETKSASTKEKLEKSAEQIESTTELLEKASKDIKPELLRDIGEKIDKLSSLMEDAFEKIEEIMKTSNETKAAIDKYGISNDTLTNQVSVESKSSEELDGDPIFSRKYRFMKRKEGDFDA